MDRVLKVFGAADERKQLAGTHRSLAAYDAFTLFEVTDQEARSLARKHLVEDITDNTNCRIGESPVDTSQPQGVARGKAPTGPGLGREQVAGPGPPSLHCPVRRPHQEVLADQREEGRRRAARALSGVCLRSARGQEGARGYRGAPGRAVGRASSTPCPRGRRDAATGGGRTAARAAAPRPWSPERDCALVFTPCSSSGRTTWPKASRRSGGSDSRSSIVPATSASSSSRGRSRSRQAGSADGPALGRARRAADSGAQHQASEQRRLRGLIGATVAHGPGFGLSGSGRDHLRLRYRARYRRSGDDPPGLRGPDCGDQELSHHARTSPRTSTIPAPTMARAIATVGMARMSRVSARRRQRQCRPARIGRAGARAVAQGEAGVPGHRTGGRLEGPRGRSAGTDGSCWPGFPPISRVLLQDAYTRGARIHSNSWGGGDPGAYDAQCEQLDRFVWKQKDMCVAGRRRQRRHGQRWRRHDQSHQRHVSRHGQELHHGGREREPTARVQRRYLWRVVAERLSGGAVQQRRHGRQPGQIVAFSSRGPTADGRFKPDVLAPGTFVLSTRSTRDRAQQHGVGGVPAQPSLLPHGRHEHGDAARRRAPSGCSASTCGRSRSPVAPTAALLKALLIASTVRLRPRARQPLVDNHQGYGLINLGSVLKPSKSRKLRMENVSPGLDTGEAWQRTIKLSGTAPLRVVLAVPGLPWPVAGEQPQPDRPGP